MLFEAHSGTGTGLKKREKKISPVYSECNLGCLDAVDDVNLGRLVLSLWTLVPFAHLILLDFSLGTRSTTDRIRPKVKNKVVSKAAFP